MSDANVSLFMALFRESLAPGASKFILSFSNWQTISVQKVCSYNGGGPSNADIKDDQEFVGLGRNGWATRLKRLCKESCGSRSRYRTAIGPAESR